MVYFDYATLDVYFFSLKNIQTRRLDVFGALGGI